jgi:protein involved in sex pheromone biosynthesis
MKKLMIAAVASASLFAAACTSHVDSGQTHAIVQVQSQIGRNKAALSSFFALQYHFKHFRQIVLFIHKQNLFFIKKAT